VAALLLALAPVDAFALCGDLSGDGYVTARDALTALRLAVDSWYDAEATYSRRARSTARSPRATRVSSCRVPPATAIPRCAAGNERTVVLTTASCDFVTGGVARIDVRRGPCSSTIRRQRRRCGRTPTRRPGVRLNRFGSNTVIELIPTTSSPSCGRCSVGSGANPHDIAIAAADKGYVTRFDSTKLAIVDPSAGPNGCAGFLRGTIDLSPWADDDGFPEMDQMVLIGDELFVSIQRLNRDSFFRPNGNGAILVIDTKTDTVVDAIELTIENPLVETKVCTATHAAGSSGFRGRACSSTRLTAASSSSIRRSVARSAWSPPARISAAIPPTWQSSGSGRAYAIVATADFHVQLVEIDLATKKRGAVLAENDSQMSDIELSENGELWLADRNCRNPGVRIFSIADNRELTDEPINPGLGPFSLEFLR
jgi:hypothetical protein